MIDLKTVTKEWLYEHIEAVESEREQIIYLLNKAIPLCHKTNCDGCIYQAYCTQQ